MKYYFHIKSCQIKSEQFVFISIAIRTGIRGTFKGKGQVSLGNSNNPLNNLVISVLMVYGVLAYRQFEFMIMYSILLNGGIALKALLSFSKCVSINFNAFL